MYLILPEVRGLGASRTEFDVYENKVSLIDPTFCATLDNTQLQRQELSPAMRNGFSTFTRRTDNFGRYA